MTKFDPIMRVIPITTLTFRSVPIIRISIRQMNTRPDAIKGAKTVGFYLYKAQV